jgi:hypothetical protein
VADEEGKVRNSRTAKSTPREVSCEGRMRRERSEIHRLRRAHQRL